MVTLPPFNKTKFNRTKQSLIKVLYVYPILYFVAGLTLVMTYFTWAEIRKYKTEENNLKIEYPRKQKEELKLNVLSVKDFIYWVKAHPDTYLADYISRKLDSLERLLLQGNFQNIHGYSDLKAAQQYALRKFSNSNLLKPIILTKDKGYILDTVITNPSSFPNLFKSTQIIGIESFRNISKDTSSTQNKKKKCIIKGNLVNSGFSIGLLYDPSNETNLIQEIVLDSLSKIRYSNQEYVIVNTFDGKALLAKGKKQIVPFNIIKDGDQNWKSIFTKQLEFAQFPAGGYYTYMWRNNPKDSLSRKTSYFSSIKDWNWIIGTGFFISDIDPLIAKVNLDLWNKILLNTLRFFIFIILVSLVGYLVSRYFSNKARNNIHLFLNFFDKATRELQVIDDNKILFSEFEELANAANKMINERETIKAGLSDERSRLHSIINAIPDLIFFKDVNSRFQGCNKAFAKYINRDASDIIGLSETDLFDKEKAKNYIASDQHIITTLKPEQNTEWITMNNGQKFLFYTIKTPYFDSSENLLGIIGVSRNITEMEETRQRLVLAKEKAEESDRLKTAFLSNMSHEIRTPMNAIIGFSDLMSEEDISFEERLDFISKVKSAGNSLMSLINDIIDIAKIEAGQLKIKESEIDLNTLLVETRSVFNHLKHTSGKEAIELNLVLPDSSTKVMVITDQLRLQQILNNLLNNAFKFTEFGSIEFGYNLEESFLTFFVKDTGIGILRSKQSDLFKRFNQLDPSTTRKFGGAGLGLAICKNLVDLLGGTIWLESISGKGSAFYFTIPYKTGSIAQNPLLPDISIYKWKSKTILIAEDILPNYLLMEALLRRTEVRLLHAVDGQAAIEMAESIPSIDLVLMDIQLPIKTGYEALKEILQFRPNIPVLSYTAFALPNERQKSIAAGFVEFIPKPIKVEVLLPILNKYLQGTNNRDLSEKKS